MRKQSHGASRRLSHRKKASLISEMRPKNWRNSSRSWETKAPGERWKRG